MLGGNVEGTRRELHGGEKESNVRRERREETTDRRDEGTKRERFKTRTKVVFPSLPIGTMETKREDFEHSVV